MDLGLVVPAALTVSIGLLRGRPWARRPMFALVGGYAFLACSVAAMAVTMYAADDPDASIGMVVGSGISAVVMVALTTYLYRPLLRPLPASARREVRREVHLARR